MNEAELLLADASGAVHAALKDLGSVPDHVLRRGFARTPSGGNLICWGEYSNVSTDCTVVDKLCYQVTIRAIDPDALTELTAAVNRALLRLGLRRSYSSPDSIQADSTAAYERTLRFSRRVDKRTLRFIN